MNDLYTIGFTKKKAQIFFELLENHQISLLIDIRLNNKSQLAGFSKGEDLQFFLGKILKCKYVYDVSLSPTQDLLEKYKKKKISWDGYVKEFKELMITRNSEENINRYSSELLNGSICLLCSESEAIHCHRSLVADLFSKKFGCKITHL